MNNGKIPFTPQPMKKMAANNQTEPSKYMAPRGNITPINGMIIITGRLPTQSEIPDTTKLPIVAEIPSVPINQLMVSGSNLRTLVRYNGMKFQQITR